MLVAKLWIADNNWKARCWLQSYSWQQLKSKMLVAKLWLADNNWKARCWLQSFEELQLLQSFLAACSRCLVKLVWKQHFGFCFLLCVCKWARNLVTGNKTQVVIHNTAGGMLLARNVFNNCPNFQQCTCHSIDFQMQLYFSHLEWHNAFLDKNPSIRRVSTAAGVCAQEGCVIGKGYHIIFVARATLFCFQHQAAFNIFYFFLEECSQKCKCLFGNFMAIYSMGTSLEQIWFLEGANLLAQDLAKQCLIKGFGGYHWCGKPADYLVFSFTSKTTGQSLEPAQGIWQVE